MCAEFTCESCGKVFESEWPDEEAQAEAGFLWGEREAEEMAVVCHECFTELMRNFVDHIGPTH